MASVRIRCEVPVKFENVTVHREKDTLLYEVNRSGVLLEVSGARNLVECARPKARRNDTIYEQAEIHSSPDIFDWDQPFVCQEIRPDYTPCRLSMMFNNVNTMQDQIYLAQDLQNVLNTVFTQGSEIYGSNIDQHVYDKDHLVFDYLEAQGVLMVVYDDPTFYFANKKDRDKFCRYIAHVLTNYHKSRTSELISLVYEGDYRFARKCNINIKIPPSSRVDWNEPIAMDCEPGDETNLNRSVGNIDKTMKPINVHRLLPPEHREVSETIHLSRVIRVIQNDNRFPDTIDLTSLRLEPQRNRIFFEHGEVPVCLFILARTNNYVDALREQRATYDQHSPWITIGLDNKVWYNCSCNVSNVSSQDRPESLIEIGELSHEPNYAPLNSNGDNFTCDSTFEEDNLIHLGVQGIADLAAKNIAGRVKYAPLTKKFYFWEGRIWMEDLDRIFLVDYINKKTHDWLKPIIERYEREQDKAMLKEAVALWKRFTSGDACARTVLDMLRIHFRDNEFQQKSKHPGLIAGSKHVVDLKSGKNREYRFDDYITGKCDYNFDECDCAPGACFTYVRCNCAPQDQLLCQHTKVKCKARCVDAMLFVNEVIKEVCGADFKQYVWRRRDSTIVLSPEENPQFSKARVLYRHTSGANYLQIPRDANPNEFFEIYRSEEKVYEDGGMRNFWRFVWTVGYVLCGEANRKLFIFSFGLQNNGKSLVWNSLMNVFEQYLGAMDPSCVYGKSKIDDSATPGLIQVVDKRGGLVPETAKRSKFNDQAIKMFTGGDRFTGRRMRSENESFRLSLVPIVSSNVLPRFDVTDGALCDRLHSLEFPITFVRQEDFNNALHQRIRNESYPAQFEEHHIRLGLFNWGVRAAHFYLNNKEKCPMPSSVLTFMTQIKNANNPIPAFLENTDQFVIDPAGRVPFKEFYQAMREYCRKNQPDFQFDQPEKFRQLLRDLKSSGTGDLELSGPKGPLEFIIGIADANAPQGYAQQGYGGLYMPMLGE